MKTTMIPRSVIHAIPLIAAIATANVAYPEVTLLKPSDGSRFQTLTDWQLKVFAGSNKQERASILRNGADKASRREWRRQRPLVFKWSSTGHDKAPWRIRLATKPDFSDARDFWCDRDTHHMKREKSADGKTSTWTYEVPRANLELGKTYYWEVWSRVKCSRYDCGFTYPETCACGKTKHGTISKVFSFTTEVEPPRWIEIEGRTKNIRDFGGWTAQGGRKVRLGLAFRGEGLNDDSVAGIGLGRSRLMVEDIHYMKNVLGIKTDLDLRNDREIPGMTASPLGDGVRFVHISSANYAELFTDWGKKAMADNFRIFCNRSNYPIYFHCIGGADRTGTLAFVLNGILGVEYEDLRRDWESTFYPELPDASDPKVWRSLAHLDKGFGKYGESGDTLQRRLELFLHDIGITPEEIAAFREIMLKKQEM